ncbi:uncharacterized protein A4U43_C09F2860 [Asparagus officinalis]|uniref:Reverse transcriptase zinc-binding domain-containing protein n=1 Tax=Asparagus officinalis TaxID=4686 RepID=A0A5P1E5C6_ASPOF|nr:uncharacterized protein A4U43_C09F2860 [Asparagus officinalis]
MQEGKFPWKYLGITMDVKKLPRQDYEPILSRIRSNLSGWKEKSLTFARKVTLAQSVLQTMPSYLLSNGWIPRSVITSIENEFRHFLWNDDDPRRYLSFIKWDSVCQSKKLGGLGIRKMDLPHLSFLAKLLIRVLHSDSSLWALLARVKYHVNINSNFIPSRVGSSWASEKLQRPT